MIMIFVLFEICSLIKVHISDNPNNTMQITYLKQIIILVFKSKMYMKLYKEHADTGKFIRKIKKNSKENINMYHFVTIPFYH